MGITALVLGSLMIMNGSPSRAQSPDESALIITSDNVQNLRSVRQFDFDRLPDGFKPASGIFSVSADGAKVITFANREGEAPLSQAVLWGYTEDNTFALNAIDGNHLSRVLSSDGRCFALGYGGYYSVWQLDPTQSAAMLIDTQQMLNEGDSVINLWWSSETTAPEPCSTDLYAEVFAFDGTTYLIRPALSTEPIFTDLFVVPDNSMAGRVGRAIPPLALTMDFENRLYRWDMNTMTVNASLQVEDYAIYGAANAPASHYVWQQTDFNGLHLIDFSIPEDRLITTYENIYFSHLVLGFNADVVLGIDPSNQRGTVQALLVNSDTWIDLGEYRECAKTQPDLAVLSLDGTTLVIGCDSGIDVWQISQE
jgi:hypothetical protein